MAKSVEIKLVEPIEWHGETIATVALAAPSGFLYMKHGDPRFGVVAADGSQYWVEKDDVISTYIAALLSVGGERVDGGDAVLRLMSLADIIKIKDTLFGFFMLARALATSGASSDEASGSGDNSTNSYST